MIRVSGQFQGMKGFTMDLQKLYDADYGWKTIATPEAEDCPTCRNYILERTFRGKREVRKELDLCRDCQDHFLDMAGDGFLDDH